MTLLEIIVAVGLSFLLWLALMAGLVLWVWGVVELVDAGIKTAKQLFSRGGSS